MAAASSRSDRMDHALTVSCRTGLRVLIAALVVAGGWARLFHWERNRSPGVIRCRIQDQEGAASIRRDRLADQRERRQPRRSGDLLVRLDETQARANNQMLAKQLEQVRCGSRA